MLLHAYESTILSRQFQSTPLINFTENVIAIFASAKIWVFGVICKGLLRFARNYFWGNINNTAYTGFGLVVTPSLEFPFTRSFGVSFTPILILNQYYTYYGAGCGIMLGLLRKKNIDAE